MPRRDRRSISRPLIHRRNSIGRIHMYEILINGSPMHARALQKRPNKVTTGEKPLTEQNAYRAAFRKKPHVRLGRSLFSLFLFEFIKKN